MKYFVIPLATGQGQPIIFPTSGFPERLLVHCVSKRRSVMNIVIPYSPASASSSKDTEPIADVESMNLGQDV